MSVLLQLPATPGRLAAAVAAGGAFAVLAWRAGLLTRAAACVAGALGAAILALGGAPWAAPTLVFFGSSAALSWLGEAKAGTEDGPRDARQVGANGGVAATLLLAAAGGVAPVALCFQGFAGAFAAAAADTWATEVGGRFGGRPRSLRTLRSTEAGASGAVSGVGTLAAAAGALAVALSAAPWALAKAPVGSVVLVVAGGGFLGAGADSVAGAFVQARYQHAQTGALVEVAHTAGGQRNRRVHGLSRLGNDGVNLLCTLVGAASAMAGAAVL